MFDSPTVFVSGPFDFCLWIQVHLGVHDGGHQCGAVQRAAPLQAVGGARQPQVQIGYLKTMIINYHHLLIRYILPSFVVGSVLYNLPKFLELEMNETGTDVEPTALRAHPLYARGYIFW